MFFGTTADDRLWRIVLKKSAALAVLGWCEESGAREFVCSQAGIGAGSGISFASFRRFWTVAARRNSS